MKKVPIVMLPILVLVFSSCASIPKGTSMISLKVTEGIQRIQKENEKVIKAFANTERSILDEKWNDIYARTEQKYLEKNKIPDPSRFTQDDRRKIAGNAAFTRETLLKEIEMRENELIEQSRANANTVITMNDEVIRYLNSLENVKETRDRISGMFNNLTRIDTSELQGIVEKQMKIFDENANAGLKGGL